MKSNSWRIIHLTIFTTASLTERKEQINKNKTPDEMHGTAQLKTNFSRNAVSNYGNNAAISEARKKTIWKICMAKAGTRN